MIWNRFRILFGGVFVVVGLAAITLLALRHDVELPPSRPHSTGQAATAKPSSMPRPSEPSGWIFGRLIGFPGADRPALTPPNTMPPIQAWRR